MPRLGVFAPLCSEHNHIGTATHIVIRQGGDRPAGAGEVALPRRLVFYSRGFLLRLTSRTRRTRTLYTSRLCRIRKVSVSVAVILGDYYATEKWNNLVPTQWAMRQSFSLPAT